MTYVFKIYFNILNEATISVSGLEIEPVAFNTIAFNKKKDLTEIQLKSIKTKLETFYKDKFNLTVEAKLEQQIK